MLASTSIASVPAFAAASAAPHVPSISSGGRHPEHTPDQMLPSLSGLTCGKEAVQWWHGPS